LVLSGVSVLSGYRQFNYSFLAVQSCSEVGDLLNATIVNPAQREITPYRQPGYVACGRADSLADDSPATSGLNNFMHDCFWLFLLMRQCSPQDRIVAQGVKVDIPSCVWAFVVNATHDIGFAMTPALIPFARLLPYGPPVCKIELKANAPVFCVALLISKQLGWHVCWQIKISAVVDTEKLGPGHSIFSDVARLHSSDSGGASVGNPFNHSAVLLGETGLLQKLSHTLTGYAEFLADLLKSVSGRIEISHLGEMQANAMNRQWVRHISQSSLDSDRLKAASAITILSAPAGKAGLTLRACEGKDWHLSGLENFGVQFVKRDAGFLMHNLTTVRGNKAALNHVKNKRFANAGEVRQRANSACCSYRFLDASLCL
jgi:hypothetical protein